MEDNYFTILWWFLPYINMNQPWVHTCPPHPETPTNLPPHPISRGGPRAPALSVLLHASSLHWWSILHSNIHVSKLFPPSSSPTEFLYKCFFFLFLTSQLFFSLLFSLPLLNVLAEVTNNLHVVNCSVFIFIDLFLVAFVRVDFFLLLKHFLPLLFMTTYSLVSRIHCWSFLWTSFAYLSLPGPSCHPQGPDIPFFLLFILSHRELLLVV